MANLFSWDGSSLNEDSMEDALWVRLCIMLGCEKECWKDSAPCCEARRSSIDRAFL